jgi:hypothetical protein
MTNPKYSGTVVVVAGYSEEMEKLLHSNQGPRIYPEGISSWVYAENFPGGPGGEGV